MTSLSFRPLRSFARHTRLRSTHCTQRYSHESARRFTRYRIIWSPRATGAYSIYFGIESIFRYTNGFSSSVARDFGIQIRWNALRAAGNYSLRFWMCPRQRISIISPHSILNGLKAERTRSLRAKLRSLGARYRWTKLKRYTMRCRKNLPLYGSAFVRSRIRGANCLPSFTTRNMLSRWIRGLHTLRQH